MTMPDPTDPTDAAVESIDRLAERWGAQDATDQLLVRTPYDVLLAAIDLDRGSWPAGYLRGFRAVAVAAGKELRTNLGLAIAAAEGEFRMLTPSEVWAGMFPGLEERPPLPPCQDYSAAGTRPLPTAVRDAIERGLARIEAPGSPS